MIDIDSMSVTELADLKDAIEAAIENRSSGVKPSEWIAKVKAESERRGKEARQVLATLFRDFFAANPAVKSIRWQQYTPYYNDGDPCEFRVHSSMFAIDGLSQATMRDADEIGDGVAYFDSWSLSYTGEKHGDPVATAHAKPCEKLQEDIKALESWLRDALGDHVQVTVGPALVMDITEYEHD